MFNKWKFKRKIRKYASELPKRLYRDYGASTFFMIGQIEVATKKLKVSPALIIYGYAMLLPKQVYDLLPPIQRSLSYEDAQADFIRDAPEKPSGPNNFYESYLGYNGTGDMGNGGSGF